MFFQMPGVVLVPAEHRHAIAAGTFCFGGLLDAACFAHAGACLRSCHEVTGSACLIDCSTKVHVGVEGRNGFFQVI